MTQFFQLLFQGFSLGCIYALVALGFTVIYRASKVINFAQGSLLLVGAYLVSVLATGVNLPFAIAVLAAIVLLAAGGVLFQTAVLRRVLGQPVFTLVMITIGLSIVIDSAVPAIFGDSARILGDPWGASSVRLGGVTLNWVRVWAIVCTAGILALFFAFDRFSRYGLAMRSVCPWRGSTLSPGRSPARWRWSADCSSRGSRVLRTRRSGMWRCARFRRSSWAGWTRPRAPCWAASRSASSRS
jgi:branched-chain amino acid transport system permease protein